MKGLFKKTACCLTAFALAVGTACSDDDKPVVPAPEPDPDPDPEYAIDIKATSALTEYGGELEPGLYGYFLALADVKLESVDPSAAGAGNVVVFEIYSSTGEENVFPAAVYPYQEVSDEDMPIPPCFLGETSGYFTTNASGEAGEPDVFTGGSVTVSGSGSNYTIEAICTFDDGRKLRFTYTGAMEFADGGGEDPEIPMIEEDVNTPFVTAVAEYLGVPDETDAGQYGLFLYSGEVEGSGSNLYPAEDGGYMLSISLFATAPEEGAPAAIVPGTYTVSTEGAAGTWFEGFIDERVYWAAGTFLEQREEEGGICSLGADGTIEITKSGDEYTVTVDLTSDLGYKIEGSYSGPIEMFDKTYASNITSDYTPLLLGLSTQAHYYGDFYEVGGNNWLIIIGDFQTGTDGMQLDLIVPNEYGFAQGLPEGEYIVGKDYEQGTYAAVYGFLNGSELIGTWFLSDFREGNPFLYAPANEGTITVAKSGDEYSIAFDFIDDSPQKNRVSGEWTGPIAQFDDSSSSGAPAKISHKSTLAKKSANDLFKAAKAPAHRRAVRWSVERK